MNKTAVSEHRASPNRTPPNRAPQTPQHRQQRQLSLLTSTSSAADGPSRSPLESLDEHELAEAHRVCPRIVDALVQLDDLLHYQDARYDAKDAELTRCIHVGEELIDQLDQLKERCRELGRERDELRAALTQSEAARRQRQKEHAQLEALETKMQHEEDDDAETEGDGEEVLVSARHAKQAPRLTRPQQAQMQRELTSLQAAIARQEQTHKEALRDQETWWHARLQEAKQDRVQSQSDWRARENECEHERSQLVKDLATLQQQRQEAERAAAAARQAEADARESLQAQQATNAALEREVRRLTDLSSRHTETRAREEADLSQQLAALQATLQRLQNDPESHVPASSALLALTATGRTLHGHMQRLVAHLVEIEQEEEQECDLAYRREEGEPNAESSSSLSPSPFSSSTRLTSRAERGKALAKAAALAAKDTPPPPPPIPSSPPQSPTAEANARQTMVPWSAPGPSSASPPSAQGSHHAWLSQALSDMVALVETLTTLWHLHTSREAHVRRVLIEKGQRAQRDAHTTRAELEKVQRDWHEDRRAWESAKAALDDAFARAEAEHRRELDEMAARRASQEESLRSTLHAAHVREKRRLSHVADGQIKSVVHEAQLEIERLQRTNARLQAQVAASATTALIPAVTPSSAPLVSPTLTDTLKRQAEYVATLEAERQDLQRRLREQEAARQALHEELKRTLARTTNGGQLSRSSRVGPSGASGHLVAARVDDGRHMASDQADEDDDDASAASTCHRLEQENHGLRARLALVVRETQDELDGLQATNTCLSRDLAAARAELSTLRQDVLPELESAAKVWHTHRQSAQEERRRLEALLDAKQDALQSMETQLAEKDLALAAAQHVRDELEAMGRDLKEALGRAAMDVQEQYAREQSLTQEVTQRQEELEGLAKKCDGLASALEEHDRAHREDAERQKEEITRLTRALQAAEDALASQSAHLHELEALAAESARVQHSAEEQRLVTTHTLEAAQSRANVAESALADAQAELERQRRLTERAKDDVRRLAAEVKSDAAAHEAAQRSWQGQMDALEAERDAARENGRHLEAEKQHLDRLCDALRAKTEEGHVAAEARLHAQLEQTTQSHQAALRVRDDQLQSLRTRLEDAESALTRSTQRLDEREAALTDTYAQLANTKAREDALQSRLAEQEVALKTLKRAEAQAQADLRAVRQACEATAASTVDKATHASAVATIEALQSRVRELEAAQQMAVRHTQRIAELEADVATARNRVEALERHKVQLQEELQVLRQRHLDAQTQHAQTVRELRQRLAEAEAGMAEALESRVAYEQNATEALKAAQAAHAASEARNEALQRAAAQREAETRTALDRAQRESDAARAAALLEARTSLAALSEQNERLTRQGIAQAREREAMSATCAQREHELEVCQTAKERLERRVDALRGELELTASSHVAERKELESLRRVNRALEGRLADVESDREPLRQRLRHLLDTSTSASVNASAVVETTVSGYDEAVGGGRHTIFTPVRRDVGGPTPEAAKSFATVENLAE